MTLDGAVQCFLCIGGIITGVMLALMPELIVLKIFDGI